MAAIYGDDIIAEDEPEKKNRLDEVLKRLVAVEVLDRIGTGAVEHGQYFEEAHRLHRNNRAFSGWKTRNTLLRSSEIVPRVLHTARISGEVSPNRQTSWRR